MTIDDTNNNLEIIIVDNNEWTNINLLQEFKIYATAQDTSTFLSTKYTISIGCDANVVSIEETDSSSSDIQYIAQDNLNGAGTTKYTFSAFTETPSNTPCKITTYQQSSSGSVITTHDSGLDFYDGSSFEFVPLDITTI